MRISPKWSSTTIVRSSSVNFQVSQQWSKTVVPEMSQVGSLKIVVEKEHGSWDFRVGRSASEDHIKHMWLLCEL